MPLARRVLMIEPEYFDANPEIASDNFFLKGISVSGNELRENAKHEFTELKSKLEKAGIEVVALNPTYTSPAPDAVFPNNWFSTHANETLVLYSMFSPLRRNERHADVITFLKKQYSNVVDLTHHEKQNRFLEGTGSIVIEHRNRIAFASESIRTDVSLFREWCKLLDYEPVVFHATDESGKPVYHTNVVLTIAENFTVICSESIRDEKERAAVTEKLSGCGLAFDFGTGMECTNGYTEKFHRKVLF
jgi:hypothetical protein